MIKPEEFDLVTCLVCGAAPKFVCTDGNTKVSCIHNLKLLMGARTPLSVSVVRVVVVASKSSDRIWRIFSLAFFQNLFKLLFVVRILFMSRTTSTTTSQTKMMPLTLHHSSIISQIRF